MDYKYKAVFLEQRFKHIRKTQDNMILLENNLDKLPFKLKHYDLIRRCIYHDLDKFKKDMIDGYYIYHCRKYIEKQEVLDSEKIVQKKHHLTNRHHVEFHTATGKPFTNIDLCEMCCDMMSRLEAHYKNTNHYKGDCRNIFAYCEERFFIKYPEMLKYKDRMYEIFNVLVELKTTK